MSRLNLANAKKAYPSVDMGVQEWRRFFATSDGFQAMGKMFYDIFNEIMSREERRAGIRRQGRRPARAAVPLSEVFSRVIPEQWSYEPLPKALDELINRAGGSHREFAAAVPMSEGQLSKILAGKRPANRQVMERLASVGNVAPWYFVEWRAIFFGDLVRDVFLESPHLAIGTVKAMQKRGMLKRPPVRD